MQVKARLNNFRRSAQKVRESSKIIKGLKVAEAISQLEYSPKGDAEQLKKLLESAIANAENNHNLDKENLFVSNIIVEEGKTMKRWRARAYGRAAQILKRTCSVIFILDELEEGKKVEKKDDKKTEKKEVKKEEPVTEEIKDKEEVEDVETLEKGRPETEKMQAKAPSQPKGGAGKKVYRRKSF